VGIFFGVAALVCAVTFATPPPAKKKAAPARQATSNPAKLWLSKLTLRQQVAQLVVARFYGEAPASNRKLYRELHRLVTVTQVGGLIVLNRVRNGIVVNAEPHAMASFLNRMQRAAPLPLIVGGDFERGASVRISGTVKFPHLMAYGAAGDLEGAKFLGAYTARESRAMGVHWVFAPDADVNNNADNPVIGLRSFGESPTDVARYVTAYIEGAKSETRAPVLVCVKHFPGHGDTDVDSHFGFPKMTMDRERLNAIELVPFRAAIAAKVDSVMTAHVTLPSVEPEEVPSTVSKNVVTGLLKRELGFDGIVTTDAMDMAGLSAKYPPGEAAVRAIEAGVDVLLIPSNADRAIDGVVKAVESGRLSRERIRQSVEKVLAAKVRLGLHRKRLVDIEDISEALDDEEALARAQQTADRAVTLVRNEGAVLPVAKPDSSCLYVLSENRYSPLGKPLIEQIKERAPRMGAQWLDSSLPDATFDDLAERSKTCSTVVAAAVSAKLSSPNARFLEKLIAGPAPVALISFANPYLLRDFPGVSAYVAPFSTAATSEAAAAKAILGAIPFRGKLPVTIPGLAEIGRGLSQ